MTKQERISAGQRLRQQRNRLQLTREQFAELAGSGKGPAAVFAAGRPAGVMAPRAENGIDFARRM